MIGAIAGDVIGSIYEGRRRSPEGFNFPLFTPRNHVTDDTVLMMAVAQALLSGDGEIVAIELAGALVDMYDIYPHAGYGRGFSSWAQEQLRAGTKKVVPYSSFGNGSAMRVAPVAYASDDLETVRRLALASARVTHNHPEGIRGAQAIAEAVFLARQGERKPAIKKAVEQHGYNIDMDLSMAMTIYDRGATCQASVPPAVIAFLDSEGYEDCVRKAIMLGGDSDTIACMAGGIAGEYYGVPEYVQRETLERMDDLLSDIFNQFIARFGGGNSVTVTAA